MEYNILSAPVEVSFHLTHACNLRCSHCYLRAGFPEQNELDPEEMSEVLDKLIKMKIFRILLTGGEPMLREDFFDIIKKLHQKMWMTLSTNGNFINNNVEELTKYVKEIAISIDGATAKSHDMFRGVKGSFDKTIKAIHNINDIKNKDIKLVINSTLTKHNIDEIDKMMDLADSLNAAIIRFGTLYPKGRALDNKHLFLDNNEVKNVIARILQKKKTIDRLGIFFDDNLQIPLKLYGYEYSDESDKEGSAIKGKRCGVGYSMFSIMPNGDIIPCDFFQESPEFIIGNALRDDLSKLWVESKVLKEIRKGIERPEICKSCKHENRCVTIKCAALIKTNSYLCNWYESK